MTDETLAKDTTEVSTESTQAETKTYTQEEVDAMMAKTRSSVEHKVAKKYSAYEELGDVETIREAVEQSNKLREKKLMEKGQFEKILQEKAQHYETELSKRDNVIREYKVNTPLINAAAKYKAVNPEQVRDLVAKSVRLNDNGDVEVVDAEGKPRYGDNGLPIPVDDVVREFLDSNPHFVQATPSTTNAQSVTGRNASAKLDLSQLDMQNPEHRAKFQKARQQGLL
jgi:hypothetical protein